MPFASTNSPLPFSALLLLTGQILCDLAVKTCPSLLRCSWTNSTRWPRRECDFGDLFHDVGKVLSGCVSGLPIGVPFHGTHPTVVKSMNDLAHPLRGTSHMQRDFPVGNAARREENYPCMGAVDLICPLPLQTMKFPSFWRRHRSDYYRVHLSASVFKSDGNHKRTRRLFSAKTVP